MSRSPRMIVLATAVCGTLDILSAFAFGAVAGVGPGRILRFVASGPFGDAMRAGGLFEAAVGLAVHYGLMFVMVAVYVAATARSTRLRRQWVVSGVLYGLIIYGVMYWLVMPARFDTYPTIAAWEIGNALFSHIVCVGLPMAWIVWRSDDGPSRSSRPSLA
jgi:hypothetical protein